MSDTLNYTFCPRCSFEQFVAEEKTCPNCGFKHQEVAGTDSNGMGMFIYSHATDMAALRAIAKSGYVDVGPIPRGHYTDLAITALGQDTLVSFWARGRTFFFEGQSGVEAIIVVSLDYPLKKGWGTYLWGSLGEEWYSLENIPTSQIIEVYIHEEFMDETSKMFDNTTILPLHLDQWPDVKEEDSSLWEIMRGALLWDDNISSQIIIEHPSGTMKAIELPPCDYMKAINKLHAVSSQNKEAYAIWLENTNGVIEII